MDNGPEFISQAVDQWAYAHGVALHFIEPGKPMQNVFNDWTINGWGRSGKTNHTRLVRPLWC
jgi:transposase InsO family protein